MEGTRLDLDAPLISVRRITPHTASSAQLKDSNLKSRRETLHSGHSKNSGSVPFIWEKKPGHPKDIPCFRDSTSQFSKDPLMEEYMIGRFLPAEVNGCKKEEEEDEEGVEESDETVSYESTGFFSSKARGLISRFRLKSLLKPVFRMKDSFEEVYWHRFGNVDFDSKLSAESNQLTYWIDSQTPEVSSSFSRFSADSNSNSSLVSKTAGTKEHTYSGYTLSSEFQRTEGNLVSETPGRYQPQSKFSRVPESDCQKKNIDNSLALSLLPPPLPKPPSDSWLQRTLPKISAKCPYQKSFLGVQFHPTEKSCILTRQHLLGVPRPAY